VADEESEQDRARNRDDRLLAERALEEARTHIRLAGRTVTVDGMGHPGGGSRAVDESGWAAVFAGTCP
jgi:hypothetical protein